MGKGRIEINSDLCKMCEYCIIQCPKKLIKRCEKQNNAGFFPAEYCDPGGNCNACKLCGIVCPEAAIEVFKTTDCHEDCGNDCKCGKGDNNE